MGKHMHSLQDLTDRQHFNLSNPFQNPSCFQNDASVMTTASQSESSNSLLKYGDPGVCSQLLAPESELSFPVTVPTKARKFNNLYSIQHQQASARITSQLEIPIFIQVFLSS
jgi:hypothetical protein